MKKYLKHGLGLIGAGAVVGSIPNLSGTATETAVKGHFMTGLGNMGSMLPTHGKMVGAGMVMKSMGGLMKASKKLTKKRL